MEKYQFLSSRKAFKVGNLESFLAAISKTTFWLVPHCTWPWPKKASPKYRYELKVPKQSLGWTRFTLWCQGSSLTPFATQPITKNMWTRTLNDSKEMLHVDTSPTQRKAKYTNYMNIRPIYFIERHVEWSKTLTHV